jgi:uncharacterized protein YcnI
MSAALIQRSIPRIVAVTAAALVLVVAAPLSASAHVQVQPGHAAPGAERTELSFAVATESAKAVTTKVQLTLPTATPFTFALVQQIAGWTGTVTTAKLPHPVQIDGARVTEAPVSVTWTADPGTRLTDGEFQNFTVAVGIMPAVARLLLPVTQTYSDGSVVRWDQRTPDGGQEPEHPAPVLYVNDTQPDAAGPAVALTASTSDGLGIALGGAGLMVALIALILALAAVRRTRQRPVR